MTWHLEEERFHILGSIMLTYKKEIKKWRFRNKTDQNLFWDTSNWSCNRLFWYR